MSQHQVALSVCPKHWEGSPFDATTLPIKINLSEKSGGWFNDVIKCALGVTPPEIRGTDISNVSFIQCGFAIAEPRKKDLEVKT